MKRREKGLTLIELMVTLAVAIVILAIGIPAFNSMSARDMSAASVNAVVAALQLARMEAVTRGRAVSVSVPVDWSTGWIVEWVNDQGATEKIREFAAPRPAQVKIEGLASPVTFNSRGEAGTIGVLTVSAFKDTNKSGTPVKVRYVCVTAIGQVRVEDAQASCP